MRQITKFTYHRSLEWVHNLLKYRTIISLEDREALYNLNWFEIVEDREAKKTHINDLTGKFIALIE